MAESEIDQLKRYFQTKFAHVSIYWLQCCLDWFKRSSQNYTQTYLRDQIFQQWLLADLQDIELPCLPPGLSKEKKLNLNGNYVLQLMYLKDISRSSLSQLRKIRDMYKLTRSTADTENEPVGKRVLYLTLTDGVQEIKAFEHETVTCLNINLRPGVKLLFAGPLLIRNGEILLKNSNVKVVGGEVEELVIPNAVENVLARELKLPENPNPGKFEEDLLGDIADVNIVNNMQNVQTNVNSTSNSFNGLNEGNNRNANNFNNNQNFDQGNNGNEYNVIVIHSDDEALEDNLITDQIDDLDDMFDNTDIDAQLDQIEQNASFQENMQNTADDEELLNINVSDFVNSMDNCTQSSSHTNDSELLNVNFNKFEKNVESFMNSRSKQSVSYTSDNLQQSESYVSDSEFLNVNVSTFEDVSTKQSASCSQSSTNHDNIRQRDISQNQTSNAQAVTNTEPFVYIKQLLESKDNISPNKKFKLKAQFLRAVEKLTVKKCRGWAMKFEITDGSGKMVVDFASNVIDELLGISAAEVIAEKSNMKNKSMVTFEKITEALNNCKKKLHSFSGIMTIQCSGNDFTFTITKLEQVTSENLQQLKRRVDSASVLQC